MGINALTAHYDKLIPQEVSIKKATHVFREISIKSQGKFIVCKMDCEGSEFDIIEDLYSNNMLSMVNVYMIEWHDRFPAKIITQLSENNYLIFNFTSKNGHVGMIYAIRK